MELGGNSPLQQWLQIKIHYGRGSEGIEESGLFSYHSEGMELKKMRLSDCGRSKLPFRIKGGKEIQINYVQMLI